MLRESWKRPSLLVAGWAVLLVSVFVLRGDLRVESRPHDIARAAAPAPTPVVVRAQRAVRPETTTIVRSGRVFDASGYLVVGAEVATADRELARTDADGRFQVELPEGRSVDVNVRAAGHGPRSVRVAAAGPEPMLVLLSPAAPWDAIPEPLSPVRFAGEGRVVTANGSPVAGARVTTLARGSGTETWARTDETGRYVLPLTESEPTLVAHLDAASEETGGGLFARSQPLQFDREHGLVPLPDLVATAACSVRGIIRDPNGSAVAGVPVRLLGNGLERMVESGTGGAFRIGGLEPGDYTLRPFAFRGTIGTPTSLRVDRAFCDCDLSLQPLVERRLRVQDTTGAPVPDAAVACEFAGERTSVQRTDAQGWTQLRLADGVLGDAWQFDVRLGDGLTPTTVSRDAGEPTTLVVALH